MIRHFGIFCRLCREAGRINVHCDGPNRKLTLCCYNCGKEEVIIVDSRAKPTKRQYYKSIKNIIN